MDPIALSMDQLRRLSPNALAYLGDAIYELHVRQLYLYPPQRIEQYHKQVVQRVRGSSQAQTLLALQPHLTPAELDLVRRGQNGSGKPPRNLTPTEYRQASGFETLIGYLYLSDPHRLQEILALTDAMAQDGVQPAEPG